MRGVTWTNDKYRLKNLASLFFHYIYMLQNNVGSFFTLYGILKIYDWILGYGSCQILLYDIPQETNSTKYLTSFLHLDECPQGSIW